MRTNTAVPKAFTHEGAPASRIKPIEQLKRTLMACLLWEASFYESGESVADRITKTAAQCSLPDVLKLAVHARHEGNLRHAPLLLMIAAIRHPDRKNHTGAIVDAISTVCKRADDLGELLSLYWKGGKQPLAHVLRRGLGRALGQFDSYRLSKYAARGAIRLRDVLFLTRPKPKDDAQAALWKQLADDTLPTADTWEAALSAGADKAETFRRLLAENNLGGLAALRNLRNMKEAGLGKMEVAATLVRQAGKSGILPFQYIAAARAVPEWEDIVEAPMLAALAEMPKLPGHTVLLVDVSGSMAAQLSQKSTLTRLDAGAALAVLLREVCEAITIYRFDDRPEVIPPRRGFALRDAIGKTRGGTMTENAVRQANSVKPDRIVIITDEQSHQAISKPHGRGYIMNVGTYENGIGYGPWTHVSGFSENLVRYIVEAETAHAD